MVEPIVVAKPSPCLPIKNMKIQLYKVFEIQLFLTSGHGTQINQAILLFGPLVFPRSFLTLSVL
jgi:hypothetical protein